MIKHKIRTFIQGFDEQLGGGIPEGHTVLIIGEPGTMKSSVAFNILYWNAMNEGYKGVYITLEQSRDSLVDQLTTMGYEFDRVGSMISIVDLSLIRKNLDKLGQQSWTEIFKMYAQNLKTNMDYDLLVIDSLPILQILARFPQPRADLFHLFEWLKDLGVTIFIISEMSQSTRDFGRFGEDYLADGIVHLKMERVDDVNIQRRIRCAKLRAANHSTNFFSLLFTDGAFQVTRVITEKLDF